MVIDMSVLQNKPEGIKSAKEMIAENLNFAYQNADYSVEAWSVYCRLERLWKRLYPNDRWEDYI